MSGLDGYALVNDAASGELVAEGSPAGQQLLWLVARGNAVIAELLRLSEHVPPVFLDPNSGSAVPPSAGTTGQAQIDRFSPLLFDFTYFKKQDWYDSKIGQSTVLWDLDEDCRDTHLQILQRFFQLFESIVRYAADVAFFCKQLIDGVFVQYTVDNILLDHDGKQLMAEAFYLYGNMLLLMDIKIPGPAREKMIVAFYRYNGRSSIKTIEDVVKVCRTTGFSINLNSRRPSKYPDELFARYPLPTNIIRMVIGRLRSDDIYNYAAAYPNPDHRSFAFSTQASMLFVLLFFCPDMLNNEPSLMREIVDKHFGDNWVISIFMGVTVDLQVWWEAYKAAKSALKNILQPNIIKNLADRFYKEMKDLKPVLKHYLTEGVLIEDYVLAKLPKVLGHTRDCNTVLRWILLHRTASNEKLRKTAIGDVRDEEVLSFLLDIGQFEYQLKRILDSLIQKRKENWERCLGEAKERIQELSEYFSGDKPLTKVKKDEGLQKWFKDLADEVSGLKYENSIVAGRRIVNIMNALENVEQFHQIESNIHIKKFLLDTREFLTMMIRTVNVKSSMLGQLSVVADFSYGWEIIQEPLYKTLLQKRVKENPRTCLLLRATFLKLVSIMELPLVRINQCDSKDVISVAAFYSAKLVGFIRSILEVLPQSMFDTLNRIIDLQTSSIKDLPMKLELADLQNYAQLNQRYELAMATHQVSVFTEGILEMKTTFVGIISVDPRDLLEQGIRKELVRQLATTLHEALTFKSDKIQEFELSLKSVSDRLSGFRRSFEYIQDYVNMYGLKVWQEEMCRLIQFNVEQESNLFMKRKVQAWESIYQSDAIPIPEFPPRDKNSLTFMGRLTRQLLVHTDYRKTVHLSERQGWFAVDGKEVVGIKTFDLLSKAFGVFGLNGVDRLICFMLVKDMQRITKIYMEGAKAGTATLDFLENLSKDLYPFSRIFMDADKVYGSALARFDKISFVPEIVEIIAAIGQKQLIRIQIQNELYFASKIDSKMLFSALDSLNQSLIMDIKTHYRNPDKMPYPDPETNPLLSELSKYLEAAGLTNPMGKIYVTSEPLYALSTFLFMVSLWQIPKMYWSSSLGLSHKSRKDNKIDGVAFVVGLNCLLKQFHPRHWQNFLALMSQYARVMASFNADKAVSQKEFTSDVLDVLLFLREFSRFGSISREVVDPLMPPYLFDKFKE